MFVRAWPGGAGGRQAATPNPSSGRRRSGGRVGRDLETLGRSESQGRRRGCLSGMVGRGMGEALKLEIFRDLWAKEKACR